MMFLSGDTIVADLIDSSTPRWKNEVIDSLFIDHEADLIKSIPLSSALSPNKLVWAETNNEKFTVGSAYKLAVTLFKSRNHGTTSDGSLNFGRKFGHCLFLIRFDIFVGLLVAIFYQQRPN